MAQQMATASTPSEDVNRELVTQIKDFANSVIFVFEPLPHERRVPTLIKAKLKAARPHKGRRRNERIEHDDEVVKNFRVPISMMLLLFMELASKGDLQLPHIVVDETDGDGKLRPRVMCGRVREEDGQLKLVVAPGRRPAQRILNQELGRLGGDLKRACKKHAHVLKKNGIDPAMIEEFVELLKQCKNSGWGVAIERPISG